MMKEPKIVFQAKKDSIKLTEEKIEKMHSFLSTVNKSDESILETKPAVTMKTKAVVINTEEVDPPANEQEILDVVEKMVQDAEPLKKSPPKKKKTTPSE